MFFGFLFLIYLFIYFWLCWVFFSVQGLSLVAASAGLSPARPLFLGAQAPDTQAQ